MIKMLYQKQNNARTWGFMLIHQVDIAFSSLSKNSLKEHAERNLLSDNVLSDQTTHS